MVLVGYFQILACKLMNAQSLISSTYQQPTTTQEEGGDKNDESQLMNAQRIEKNLV